MSRKRVHEIAKQQGLTSKEVLAALNAAGIEAKAAASSVEEGQALEALAARGDGATGDAKPAQPTATPRAAAKKSADGKAAAKGPRPPAQAIARRASGETPERGARAGGDQDRLRRDRARRGGKPQPRRRGGDQEADGAGRDGDAHPDPPGRDHCRPRQGARPEGRDRE